MLWHQMPVVVIIRKTVCNCKSDACAHHIVEKVLVILVIHAGSLEQPIRFSASEIQRPKLLDDTPGPSSIHPAILAGLFGVGALNIAYADGDQVRITPKIIMWIIFQCTLH